MLMCRRSRLARTPRERPESLCFNSGIGTVRRCAGQGVLCQGCRLSGSPGAAQLTSGGEKEALILNHEGYSNRRGVNLSSRVRAALCIQHRRWRRGDPRATTVKKDMYGCEYWMHGQVHVRM
jgi:hypothetical protein